MLDNLNVVDGANVTLNWKLVEMTDGSQGQLQFQFMPFSNGLEEVPVAYVDIKTLMFRSDSMYQNRTYLVHSHLNEYGIQINHVTNADEGHYRCYYYGNGDKRNFSGEIKLSIIGNSLFCCIVINIHIFVIHELEQLIVYELEY